MRPSPHIFVVVLCFALGGALVYYILQTPYTGAQRFHWITKNIYSAEETEDLDIQGEQDGGYYFEPCKCKKYKDIVRNVSSQIESQCSDEADWIGAGQRVVSFTLYEDKKAVNTSDDFKLFVEGISRNAHDIKTRYPGWTLRLYSNHELDEEMCGYACRDDIVWCDTRQERLGDLKFVNFRTWRFLVIGDPTVDVFMSRDLDSVICDREQGIVEQWLNLPFTFHCARDVPQHNADMWAGMWGAKNNQMNATVMASLREEFLKRATNVTNTRLDENLLTELVYNKFPKDILCHDAYRRKNPKHRAVKSVPFPTQRKARNERLALNSQGVLRYKALPCPVECRPSYGKNWTYC